TRRFEQRAGTCLQSLLPSDRMTVSPITASAPDVNAILRAYVHWSDRHCSAPARVRPPDGLRTPAEATRRLRCSRNTLNGHVASGVLRYVLIGHGRKRRRVMFTDAELDDFIKNQTRKDSPCPSAATRARRSGNIDSRSEVISFSALRKRPRAAKPKR